MTTLLLHIGMPKTGTSALQATLAQGRSKLLEQNILYPEIVHTNHDILAAGYRPLNDLSRQYRQLYENSIDKLNSDFGEWWGKVKSEVERQQPEMIILSGELMFSQWRVKALRERLEEITTDIRVVIYVRQPSKHFLSLAHQQLRMSSKIGPWRGSRIRPIIEEFSKEFIVTVIAYERSNLKNQDITSDFIARFIPRITGIFESTAVQEVNPSYSPEAMAIMQKFRLEVYPDNDDIYFPESHFFLTALDKASTLTKGTALILREEIANAIDYSTAELGWLRDVHGVVFSDLDYRKIGSAPPFTIPAAGVLVEDICRVDAAAYNRLLMLTMHGLANRASRT